MSGVTYSVQLGEPQQLTGAPLGLGTTIVSQDNAATVWLGSDQTVSPGNGIPLTPLGNVAWTGKQLWACVNTGVVNPVVITVSSDVTNFNNPVAVGVAVAVQLLATGIPLVLIEDQLMAGLPVIPAFGGVSTLIDCSKYASLIVASPTGLSTSGWRVRYAFYDDSGLLTAVGRFGIPADPTLSGFTLPPFQIPVSGTHVQFYNDGVIDLHLYVDGTNRTVDRLKCLYSFAGNIENLAVTTTFVPGTTYSLGLINSQANTDLLTVTFEVFAATVKGAFTFTDFLNQIMVVADTGEMFPSSDGNRGLTRNIKMPASPVYASFICNTTGGAGNALISVIG